MTLLDVVMAEGTVRESKSISSRRTSMQRTRCELRNHQHTRNNASERAKKMENPNGHTRGVGPGVVVLDSHELKTVQNSASHASLVAVPV